MLEEQYNLQSIRRLALDLPTASRGTFLEHHTLLVILQGFGYLYLNERKYRLKAKEAYYCPPGALMDVRVGDAFTELELYELQYEIWTAAEYDGERILYNKSTAAHIDQEQQLSFAVNEEAMTKLRALEEIWPDSQHTLPNNSSQRQRLLLDATFKLVIHSLFYAGQNRSSDEEWKLRIQQAAEYMNDNFASSITRSELAKRVGLTPEHFSVSFKKVMGIGFSEYLTKLRIDKAKEKLLGADRNLNKIAREIGYRDGLYLSRKFKQQTGMAPRDYIQKPKKIIALQYLGHLLALGLMPVGTTTKLLHALPYRNRLDHVADVGDFQSLRGIAELQPDLIITAWPNPEPWTKLATTLSIPWGREDCLDELLRLGKSLNRINEAKAWIEAFQVKEKQAAEQVHAVVKPGATAAVFEFWSDKIWAVNSGYGRGLRNLYRSLSFRPPESLIPYVTGSGIGLELSANHLAPYAPDLLFVSVWKENGGLAHAQQVMSSEHWNSLPAVKNGHVYPIDLQLFKYNDPIALEQQLQVQLELLTKVHKKPHFTK